MMADLEYQLKLELEDKMRQAKKNVNTTQPDLIRCLRRMEP